jgi:hypothetical protein
LSKYDLGKRATLLSILKKSYQRVQKSNPRQAAAAASTNIDHRIPSPDGHNP